MLLRLYSLLLFLCCCHIAQAQDKIDPDLDRNKGKAFLIHFNLGTHFPVGELSDRFGRDQSIGAGMEQITAGNFIWGAAGALFFGQQVNEDPLAGFRTPEGGIIGADQTLASIVLRERGYHIDLLFGKLFVFNPVKRAGLRVTGSVGWIQHKIRLQDDSRTVSQINGAYVKGYDRLTGGLHIQEFVGWQHLAANRRANWYAGLEFGQGLTTSLRSWDFAEQRRLDGRRLDMRIGVKVGWTLPFYSKGAERIYY